MEPCRPKAVVVILSVLQSIIKRSEKVFFGKKKNAAPAFPTVQKTAPLFDKGMNVLVTRHRAQNGGDRCAEPPRPPRTGKGDYRGIGRINVSRSRNAGRSS